MAMRQKVNKRVGWPKALPFRIWALHLLAA